MQQNSFCACLNGVILEHILIVFIDMITVRLRRGPSSDSNGGLRLALRLGLAIDFYGLHPRNTFVLVGVKEQLQTPSHRNNRSKIKCSQRPIRYVGKAANYACLLFGSIFFT